VSVERDKTEFLDSGSTLLNLALTGRYDCGWRAGRVANLVGDRSTGKTLVAIGTAALFLRFPRGGKKPRVVYMEAESAFDEEYARTIGLPEDGFELVRLNTVEAFEKKALEVAAAAKEDEAYLIVVDSLDGLLSEKDKAKRDEGKGSYGMGKTKALSSVFPSVVGVFEEKSITPLIISQVRFNINAGLYGPKYTRAGGKALDHALTHEVWLHERRKLFDKAPYDKIPYGINIEAHVTKNKIGRAFRRAALPIIFDHGVDDVTSLLDFLASNLAPEEQRLIKNGSRYRLEEGGESRYFQDWVMKIDGDPALYRAVVARAQDAWDGMEAAIKPERTSNVDLRAALSDDAPPPKPKPEEAAAPADPDPPLEDGPRRFAPRR